MVSSVSGTVVQEKETAELNESSAGMWNLQGGRP
jgi:hypothetical protein